jgi:serine/threonine-protein kinase RsbW
MNDKEYISESCDLVELEKVRKFIKIKVLALGLKESDADSVALAVDEACTNLIRHAFNLDKNNRYCISVEKKNKKIIVCIMDNGVPFDPKSVNKPDMEEYFKEYRRGGLGIYLMRSVMDDIKYFPADKDRKQNTLKLIKNLNY